jgi:hypothetical protein
MEKSIMDAICRQVYAQYPEVKGKHPRAQAYGNDQYLLVFRGSSMTPDGKKIERAIRVVTTAGGKIVKISSSK